MADHVPVLLEASGLAVSYGAATAVSPLSLTVPGGAITALVGPNGAGKSSTLLALFGAVVHGGTVGLGGIDVTALSQRQRQRRGIALVPQGRQLFPDMSVEENLRVAADLAGRARADVERGLDLFAVLRERRRAPAGVLSGGQQQMLALARALITRPDVLLLDEPIDGLAVGTVRELLGTVRALADEGMAVLIAEPTIGAVLGAIDRGYVLSRGNLVAEASSATELESAYERELGLVGSDSSTTTESGDRT